MIFRCDCGKEFTRPSSLALHIKWEKVKEEYNEKPKLCKKCGKKMIWKQRKHIFCSNSCAKSGKDNPFYGKTFSDEHKEKLRIVNTGRKHTEETKKKLSELKKGYKHTEEAKQKIREKRKLQIITEEHKKNIGRSLSKTKYKYKQYYNKNKIPLFDTYAHQIDWCEDVKRNKEDPNILNVKCAYCGKWYIPSLNNIYHRIQYLKGNKNYTTEHKFYCSSGCKKVCPIFYKSPYTLMREDAIRAGRLNWLELNREVQPELRQMVLKRDDYGCQKCETTEELHCHHIYPVATDPLLSADVDNCITLCKKCHKGVHKMDGCKYGQLRSCIE